MSPWLNCSLPRRLQHILEQPTHDVTAVVCARPPRAGAELGLGEQGVEGADKGFVGEGLAAQRGLGACGAEGSRAAGTDGDVNVGDEVVLAREPDGAVEDGEGDALGAHDAFEAGGVFWGSRELGIGNRDVEADDDLFGFVDGGFAGAEEQ